MYATYYDRTFPVDHDMGLIRERVAEVGPSMDEHDGLGFKAYLLNGNRVSSFYLWHDPVAMAEFFFSESGFADLVRHSGRPTVEHWLGVTVVAGPARDSGPRAASRRISALPTDLGPELAALTELADRPDVHTAALVADPKDWRLLRFVLWANEVPAEEDAERFEVMHLSAPGIAELRGMSDVRDAV
ncbi:MAG TPA: DUF4865 family protein [Pseudonocardiaceae bacterium]|jgi:hypothetical protein